ncbi:MAG: preprotein translocase subunit SecE [Dehalococcoidia bacterium]
MGREARRQQERAERRQKQRETAAPRRAAASTFTAPPAAGEERGRGSLLKPRWATDIISELRKVTWPTRRETANLTGVVIIVSIALGVLLGGADLLFGWLVEQTLLR